MCSHSVLTIEEQASIKPLSRPIHIMTAKGVIVVKEFAAVYVSDLNATVNMILAKDAPLLLSMGKLCGKPDGFCDYTWKRAQKPRLTVYKGEKVSHVIELEITKDCPICHANVDSEAESESSDTKRVTERSTPYNALPDIPAMPDAVFDSPVPAVGGDVVQDDVAADPVPTPKPKRKKKRTSLEEQHKTDVMCKPCDGSLENHNTLTHHP